MTDVKKDFEAVILNSFEHDGEKKWRRTFIGNLVPDREDGEGYNLYIPEGVSVSGRLRIQPKQAKDSGPEQSL